MKTLTDATFSETLSGDKPVLVDFWAPWCGPCKQIAPVLDKLDTTFADRVVIAKLNVDENPKQTAAFGIRGIPALILFKNGAPAATLMGAQTEQTLIKWLEANL